MQDQLWDSLQPGGFASSRIGTRLLNHRLPSGPPELNDWPDTNGKVTGLNIRKSLTNVLSASGSVIVLLIMALWQFYLFIASGEANGTVDPQGARLHLWLAIGIALIACLAGLFVYSVFFRSNINDRGHIISWDDS
jgi:hypothetical protein